MNTATTALLFFTAILVFDSAREPLTSAFDSARVPNVGGERPRAPSSHLVSTKPLSPQYRILLRLHKPQIPQLNLYSSTDSLGPERIIDAYRFLKKNQSTPRPSEHPPVMGEKMSKRLGGIKGCKYKTSSWHLNRFPDADNLFVELYH